jgi:hypothetical protein
MPKLKKRSIVMRRRQNKEIKTRTRGGDTKSENSEHPEQEYDEVKKTLLTEEMPDVKNYKESHDVQEPVPHSANKRKKLDKSGTQCSLTPYRERLRLSKRKIAVDYREQCEASKEECSQIELRYNVRQNTSSGRMKTVKRREQAHRNARQTKFRINQRIREIPEGRSSSMKDGQKLECITRFMEAIKEGPTYICSCCGGLWFRTSVKLVEKSKLRSKGLSASFIDQVKNIIIHFYSELSVTM